MERLILFAVAAIIWSVVKALSQPAPKRPVPRQAAPLGQRNESRPQGEVFTRSRETFTQEEYFTEQPAMALQVEELEETVTEDIDITSDDLVKGIIMAEVLGPPRAKRPHRLYPR